jgi:hypothetical protein
MASAFNPQPDPPDEIVLAGDNANPIYYYEHDILISNKFIKIRSSTGNPVGCVIDAQTFGRVMRFQVNNAIDFYGPFLGSV